MFNFLFNPNGRVTLRGMWLGFLIPFLVLFFGLSFASDNLGEMSGVAGLLLFLVLLFYLWPAIAVPAKRFHDIGLTGWVIPVFFLLYIIFFGVFLTPIMAQMPWGEIIEMAENNEQWEPTPQEEAELENKFEEAGQSPMAMAGLGGFALTWLVSFVLLYLWPGKRGENKYGPDPRG